jgi:hypothetical protein
MYARVVAEFVERHRGDEVTEALNRVYLKQSASLDLVLEQIQYLSLPREESSWPSSPGTRRWRRRRAMSWSGAGNRDCGCSRW